MSRYKTVPCPECDGLKDIRSKVCKFCRIYDPKVHHPKRGKSTDPCLDCNINKRYVSESGRQDSYCRDCRNARQYTKSKRFYRFGLTKSDLTLMLIFQGGRCDVCKEVITIDTCHVDHDTSCCPNKVNGKIVRNTCGRCVRGLLCMMCNHGLGSFRDNIQSLKNAIQYLERMSK